MAATAAAAAVLPTYGRPSPPLAGGRRGAAEAQTTTPEDYTPPARPRPGRAVPHTQRARGLSCAFAQPYAELALANSRPQGTHPLSFPTKPRPRHDAWASPLLSTIDFSSVSPPPWAGWRQRQRLRRYYQPTATPPPPCPWKGPCGRRLRPWPLWTDTDSPPARERPLRTAASALALADRHGQVSEGALCAAQASQAPLSAARPIAIGDFGPRIPAVSSDSRGRMPSKRHRDAP